jgi:periplasmic divalent cation tolerance protein
VSGCVQVSTTVDSAALAELIAATLVEERLAACVQIVGPMTSVYRWDGAVTRAREWLCTAKTVEPRQAAVMARIRALHTYQQPEIIATSIAVVDPGYASWLQQETISVPERP